MLNKNIVIMPKSSTLIQYDLKRQTFMPTLHFPNLRRKRTLILYVQVVQWLCNSSAHVKLELKKCVSSAFPFHNNLELLCHIECGAAYVRTVFTTAYFAISC